MDRNDNNKVSEVVSTTSIQDNCTKANIEMEQEFSSSTQLEKTETKESNTQVIAAQTSSKDVIYKGVLDTSIDSGIYDDVIKGDSVNDKGNSSSEPSENLDAEADKTLEQTSVETATNKNLENFRSADKMTRNTDKDISESCNNESKMDDFSTDKSNGKEALEDPAEMQDKANATNTKESSLVNDLDIAEPVKSVESNKDMDVEDKSQPRTKNKDVIGESSGNVMMEYRTAEEATAVDGSSDSSPDSSDSDDDQGDDEKPGAKDTESQLNKIISSERDISPEREKRVKLNRHGFEDIRTKGELLPEDLPPLEELTITVDESVVMVEVGTIKSIVGILVVIQSNENVPPLDDETILFVDGHKVLGQVFEVFGPVKTPWYSVRFNEANNIEAKGLEVGMPVFCAPREDSFTKFVFVDSLKSVKGSDASWEDNNEPPEKHLDYSDDESERRAKAKRRNKKFGDNEGEKDDDGESAVQKKNPRQRNRNRPKKDNQSGFAPPQQTQHPKRGWNPFKGNQNETSGPPRYGGRHQDNQNNSHSNGQRWPHSQNNFNRPQSRFGGPPNFQNRPRMGQNQPQLQYGGRNSQHQNNWRPPVNNFTNDMQNLGQQPFNGPPPNKPFNMQGAPPTMGTQGFGPRQGQSTPLAPMNVDFSQPPPQFQPGNPVKPPNQTGNNPWVGRQGMPQQNAPFIVSKIQNQNNQSFPPSQGSQPNQQQIVGNQMCSQPISSLPFQSTQSNILQPGSSSLQNSMGNFQNFGMNSGQNIFNQPPPNSFQQNPSHFQTNSNFNGLSTLCGNNSGMGGLNGQNFTAAVSGGVQFTGMNPVSCNSQPSSTQGQKLANFQIQNIPGQSAFNNGQNGDNTNLVQNQNFINNQQQCFSQGNVQTNSSGNQFVPPQGYGFQNNVGQIQPAGQGGFNQSTGGSYPFSGNNLMPNGNSSGFNQMSGNVQPGVITDQRFIQNNS